MDQKRLILAAFLSLLVLLGWSFLLSGAPKREPVTPAVSADAPTARAVRPATAGVPASPPPTTQATRAAPRARRSRPPPSSASRSIPSRGHAVFTNRGAQLLSYRVKDVTGQDGQPLEMVRARAEGPYPFALTDPTGAPLRSTTRCSRSRGPSVGDRRQPGRAVPLQRRRRRRDQGVPVPRQWSDRGGDPPRRRGIRGAS